MSFEEHMTLDARLVVLRALADQRDCRLNEVILVKALETYGHNRSRDWLRTQLRLLADLGAVRVTEAGTVMIAELTRLGEDHVQRRAIIEGVARPSLL